VRALVAGWFSFERMGATAGDLYARDLARGWLDEARVPHDVAHALPFAGGVDWRAVDPGAYSHLVFVCGPFGNGPPLTELLERFREARLVGLDLSLVQPLDEWDPFDVLLERDSSATARPDISFLATEERVPVVGVVLVHPQKHPRAMHETAERLIDELLALRPVAPVRIDTRLDIANASGLRTPVEIESVIARMDAVVTTRLHGMVLALKNGVPAVVIDPIGGGDKVLRQAVTIGWPVAFTADGASVGRLDEALTYCLSEEARAGARRVATRAVREVGEIRERFISSLVGAGRKAR